ncbi:MAG: ATP-binding protein [Bacillota bacterium]|nr:ATP-binding protein [Bacillota bacterium]
MGKKNDQNREKEIIKNPSHNRILLSLIARGTWARGELAESVAEITEACSELIRTERVSIWLYSDDYATIRCIDLYERSKQRHCSGEELPSSQFPLYTESHIRGEIVATADVFADPRTRDIPSEYYLRHNIKSLLDTPIRLHDRIGGLLSFASTGEHRNWTENDEKTAAAMALVVSLAVEAAERNKAEQAMRENEKKYRKLAESADAILWEYDLQLDHMTYIAPQAERILGYRAAEWEKPQFWSSHIHPDDRKWAVRHWLDCVHRGEDFTFEYRFIKKNGEIAWLRDDVIVEIVDDKPAKARGFMIDITERRKAEEDLKVLNQQLEERVYERTARFEEVVSELESFTYSVSHDLRAPLRVIDGFSQVLLEDHAHNLNEEARCLLNKIRSNTEKMDRLITGLLALSRATRVEIQHSAVDMAILARSVYDELADEKIRESFTFVLDFLPTASGDPVLLRQVWQNLISNAIKFTRPVEERRIEIGGFTEYGINTYYIRDSGVGFDSSHADKLFGVFKRLHDEKDFEGAGVGLAIVKRIVQRHGGEVRAESETGRGTTVYFSLPAVDLLPPKESGE